MFLACFLKSPRNLGSSVRRRLRDLFEDLEMYNVPLPELQPLSTTALRHWAAAPSPATKRDRTKPAQLEAVPFAALVELQVPEALRSSAPEGTEEEGTDM